MLLLALVMVPGASTALMQDEAVARIDAPAGGESIVGKVEVRGRAVTADPAQFSFYRLYYGSGSEPTSLRPIGSPGDQPVENGVLGIWDTSPLIQGEYTLQLTVYNLAGATTTTSVVVTVLPAPTPTPLSQPSVRVPVPGETPTPGEEEETGPPPTPLPEIPPLVPDIPQIDTSPLNPSLPVQPVDPSSTDPGFQPIPIPPGQQAPLPPAPLPGAPNPGAPSTFDPGAPSSAPPTPSFNPIAPVGPPPPPAISPYEPPPTLAPPAIPTPTIFGLP
ncbi:MAG: hypothetical protein AB7P40_14640 [Chloroflexota bacterium]